MGVIDHRMTLGYFCVSGLDLLGYFEGVSEGEEDEAKRKTRESWIEWVWEMQDRQYVSRPLSTVR
jgi:hypothetical protein